MTDQQMLGLVFRPGFSTKGMITDLSGRGVGLDVVLTNIERMKGTITVSSTPGRGSVFSIRLPITLATTQALLVKVSGQTFAIPLAAVEIIGEIGLDQVTSVESREAVLIEGGADGAGAPPRDPAPPGAVGAAGGRRQGAGRRARLHGGARGVPGRRTARRARDRRQGARGAAAAGAQRLRGDHRRRRRRRAHPQRLRPDQGLAEGARALARRQAPRGGRAARRVAGARGRRLGDHAAAREGHPREQRLRGDAGRRRRRRAGEARERHASTWSSPTWRCPG